MSLIKPTILIDIISTLWVTIIAVCLFVWLPVCGIKTAVNNNIVSQQKPSNDVFFLGLWLRNMFLILSGVLILSYFNLLNWLTVVLLYIACVNFNYLKSHGWKFYFLRQNIQNKIISLVDFLDKGLAFTNLMKNIAYSCKKTGQKSSDRLAVLVTSKGVVFFALLIAVCGFTLLLRWEYPLSQLRFSHPDNYNTLLITRQILAKDYPLVDRLPAFSSLTAIISLLGSTEPMQVIRFLSPFVGIALVICVGFLVRVLTDNAYSALVATFTLGLYLFTFKVTDLNIDWLERIVESLNSSLIRQWTGNELELGTIFLLLGLGYCFQSKHFVKKTHAFKVNLACSVALVGICAPSLIIIFAIACIGLIGNKKQTLTAITLAWIVLAVFAAMSQGKIAWLQSFLLTLPVALSLLAGLLFAVVSDLIEIFIPKGHEIFCLGLIFSLSINFFLPLAPSLTYLEYDMAARKTLEIKNRFPAQSWTLVAPIEQLAQIYGEGWYEDLALFVEQYAEEVKQPEFAFPISGEDLFVMVEKIPFVTFPDEPDVLPNSVLSDRTYQYYRSTAGRASLEYEALRMCKAYSRLHSNTSDIYYEDRELIVYHFAKNHFDSEET